MRILHVGKYYHPFHGGIETSLKALAEGLRQAGDQVTVLCSSHAPRSGERFHEEEIQGVRVIRMPTWANLWSQPISPRLVLSLRELARGHDVVHLHSPNVLAELAALALPRECPLLLTYHSDIIRQRAVLPLYLPLFRQLLGRVRRILVSTPQHIEYSRILPAYRAKCTVIPFGLEAADFEANDAIREASRRLRERYGSFVLFVGRLVPYKGVRYLIEAMKQVPEGVKLVIVGDGPLRSELAAQVEALGLGSRVHLAGRVDSPEDWIAHYHACDVFALPSIDQSETFGLTLLEAMACAKPLLTTRIPSGVLFVNEDGVTGLQVPPKDPEALAGALRKLLEDPGLRVRMGEAAFARFQTHFTRARMIEATRACYRAALS